MGITSLFFWAIHLFLDKEEWITLFLFLKEQISFFFFKKREKSNEFKRAQTFCSPQLVWFSKKNDQFALKKSNLLFHTEWIPIVLKKVKREIHSFCSSHSSSKEQQEWFTHVTLFKEQKSEFPTLLWMHITVLWDKKKFSLHRYVL